MPRRIAIDPTAAQVLARLNDAGYAAYAVGGCVRDALLGGVPTDWDICTSAAPDDIEAVFSDCKTIDIGKKHGTVAVLFGNTKFEITTFRADGSYSDARHPTSVSFAGSLKDDLSRRDFTINAMAADAEGEVTDLFGGVDDLDRKLIRCVGDPLARFSEDALRILRALRFMSVLDGFALDAATADAARQLAPLIQKLSGERILAELQKLLCGRGAERVLMSYPDVLAAAIPEIAPCVGFEHLSSWHCYDVWEHICRSIALSPREPRIRLALLFHDIAKPQCVLLKPNGHRSFHGHPEASAEVAKARLTALHAPAALREGTTRLVLLHDEPLEPTPLCVGRFLRELGVEQFFLLASVQLADALAHNLEKPGAVLRVHNVRAARELAREMIASGVPYAPSMLPIHGDELDVPPPLRGQLLARLCDDLLAGKVKGDRDALLAHAKSLE